MRNDANLRYGYNRTPMSCGAFILDEDSLAKSGRDLRDKMESLNRPCRRGHPINYYGRAPCLEHPGDALKAI